MIEAGKLGKRVTIVYCERHDDGAGGSSTIWRDGDTVWAEVLPLRGDERIQADAVESAVTHRVRIRKAAASDVEAEDRLRMGSREFHVQSVIDYGERGEFLECQVEERRR